MCGRTSLSVDPAVLQERFDADLAFEYHPRYNIAPRDDLATIRNTDESHVVQQEWGLLPHWADDPEEDNPRPINARAETVAENNMFEQAFEERRCLVLADGFYEWTGERGSKQPYRVHLENDAPFAMAGIWNRWENGEALETVAILTTEANEVVEPIHDRMPVVLAEDEEADWLAAEPDEATALCDPYGERDMAAYEVSRAVNDPENDRPEVVRPAPSEQSGIDDFRP